MSALPPESQAPGFIAANAGKLLAAFVAGFILFAGGVVLSIRSRETLRMAPTENTAQATSRVEVPVAAPDIARPLSSSPVLPALDSVVDEPFKSPLPIRRNKVSRGKRTEPLPSTEAGAPKEALRAAEEQPAGPAASQPAETIHEPASITVPAETVLTVRVSDALSSRKSEAGDVFRGTLAAPLESDGVVVAPAGSHVTGRVVGASRAGLLRGRSVLSLELTALQTADGRKLDVKTTQWFRNGGHNRLAGSRSSEVEVNPGGGVSFRLLSPITIAR